MTQSTKIVKRAQLTGLTHEEVLFSRKKYGSNLFTKRKRKSFLMKYLESFGDPIIKILMAALAVNVLLMFHTHNIFETILNHLLSNSPCKAECERLLELDPLFSIWIFGDILLVLDHDLVIIDHVGHNSE